MSVSSWFNREVNVDIEAPMTTKLRVSIVHGGITIDNGDSEIEINTVDGGITLASVGARSSLTRWTETSPQRSRA